MIIDELFEGPQLCPECGGISFSDLILAEKKDACYYKVKASAKVWPSAYASGRLVQCRKKGAANYGNKSEGVAEGSGDISSMIQQYEDMVELVYDLPPGRKKNIAIDRRDALEAQIEAMPGGSEALRQWAKSYNDAMDEGVAEGISIVDQDSDLDQEVYTLNVDGKKVSFTYWDYENNFQNPNIKDIYQQAKEQLGRKLSPEQIKDVARAVFKSFEQGVAEQQELDEKWSQKYKKSINCANPRGFSQRAHCAGRKKNEDMAEAGPIRRDPLDLPPLEGPGSGSGSGGGPSRSGPSPFTPVKIPGTNINIPGVTQSTSPPPVVTKTPNINKQLDPALDVPAYVRQGKPDPVTVPKPGTKPKITVRPGETVPQAMQRTKAEQEFGQFLKGQSGQTFGAGRGTVNPPAAKSNAPKELTIDPNDPKTFTKQATSSNPEMDKIMKKWDQEQRSTPASLPSQSKSKTSPSKFLQLFGPDKMDEASRKKREQPEVDYDDEYDAMVARVKKLAGLGPMKTVYDPTKRVYRNMPTAVQPKK